MPTLDIPTQTLWQLDVCNACRYCEGYCAVFPALEKRRRVQPQDVVYLANLCHDCRACLYACMYAPPHEFGVNIPKALADVREQTYAAYSLPRIVSDLAQRNVLLLAGSSLVSLVFLVLVVFTTGDPARLFTAHLGPGAFYAVVPYLAMLLPALVITLYAVGVLAAGAFAFMRDQRAKPSDFLGALGESFVLRYMRGGTQAGCNYPTERASNSRLILHMLVFYGFLLALAATTAANIMQDIFGLLPPYPVLSVPVVLGTLGGVGLIVGATGLLYLKWQSDRAAITPSMFSLDWLFLISLDVVSITGMLTLFWRDSAAMGVLLILHLATVLAFFVAMPYSKFAHFVYRYAALVQNRLESRAH